MHIPRIANNRNCAKLISFRRTDKYSRHG